MSARCHQEQREPLHWPPGTGKKWRLRRRLIEQWAGRCHWCGCPTLEPRRGFQGTLEDDYPTVDHFYSRLDPRREDEPHLYVLACNRCNQSRAFDELMSLGPEEWYRRSGRLPLRLLDDAAVANRLAICEENLRLARRKLSGLTNPREIEEMTGHVRSQESSVEAIRAELTRRMAV